MSSVRALAAGCACVVLLSLFQPFAAAAGPGAGAPQVPDTAFRIFRSDGTGATLEDIAAAMDAADVVFVGEDHDDPAAHDLEARLLRTAFERFGGTGRERRSVALSLEMFERDVQPVLDEYLAGLITEAQFLKSSRPWKNYQTDYKPLVEFAREHRLPVLAANAPERYVNRAGRLGKASLDALPKGSRSLLPRLPYAEASAPYAEKFRRAMSEMGHEAPPAAQTSAPAAGQPTQPASPPQSGPSQLDRMLDAQSLRDATMADSIARYLKDADRGFVVQVNGRFHSESKMGILDHLARYRSKARFLVVTIEAAKGFPEFDQAAQKGLGDFVILTDPNLPRPAQK